MPNKVYVNRETPIRFEPSGGDVTFTPTSIGNGTGRISNRLDRGTAAHADRYEWRAKTKLAAPGTVGRQVEIYLVTSDGTIADANQGTADASITAADARNNMQYIGGLIVDNGSGTASMNNSGVLTNLTARFLQVVFWDDTGTGLSATAGDHAFILTPAPAEVQ